MVDWIDHLMLCDVGFFGLGNLIHWEWEILVAGTFFYNLLCGMLGGRRIGVGQIIVLRFIFVLESFGILPFFPFIFNK